MKVIIAGSRTFEDKELLYSVLDKFREHHFIGEIVSGTAKGADSLGEQYGIDNGIPIKRFPADWNKHGKKAGYIRNEEMAKYGDYAIIFWDGKSMGTMHMRNLAKKYNLKVKIILYEKIYE